MIRPRKEVGIEPWLMKPPCRRVGIEPWLMKPPCRRVGIEPWLMKPPQEGMLALGNLLKSH